MSRTLFLGDSHSCGYYVENYEDFDNSEPVFWSKNNYAEIYSNIADKPVIIYAIPAGCNKKYPTWIRAMFDCYQDIDEVFVQSTYWNRHLIGVNKNLDIADGLKANHFANGPNPYPAPQNTPLIDRWADVQITENYIEVPTRTAPEKFDEYEGFELEEIKTGMQDLFSNKTYAYTKLWHEHITHLQYREFCGDLFIIDTLCKQYGVTWNLWHVNERVVMPKDLSFYGSLENCNYGKMSVQEFVRDQYNFDIENHQTDGEHYSYRVHEIIAKEYIPYLKKTLTKPK